MKKFGLIGHPIAHSLSPSLFNAGYCGRYSYDLIEGEDFGTSYRKFIEEYDGINVTAPFKEYAIREADIVSPECGKIGASNLLVKTDEGIKAYNSDYYGIILSIVSAIVGTHGDGQSSQPGLPPRPSQEQARSMIAGRAETALVVGAGGAGKAAAVAAASLGLKTTLMNRTLSKAEKIAAELPEYHFDIHHIENFAEMFRRCDIVIYTLPRAIEELSGCLENGQDCCRGGNNSGNSQDGCQDGNNSGSSNGGDLDSRLSDGLPCRTKYILEANYRDPALKFLAGSPGIVYIPGEQWLLYQAYAGYDLFTGEIPDLGMMRNVISA